MASERSSAAMTGSKAFLHQHTKSVSKVDCPTRSRSPRRRVEVEA